MDHVSRFRVLESLVGYFFLVMRHFLLFLLYARLCLRIATG